MSFVLYSVIVAGCTYIGWGIAQYYRKRVRIFFEFSHFCERLKTDIGFLLMPLGEILHNASKEYSSPAMKEILSVCENVLKKGIALNKDILEGGFNCKFITEEERQLICGFFSMLGKTDEKTQIDNIESYRLRFSAAEDACRTESKKYCPMFNKLGFLFGIAICLFII